MIGGLVYPNDQQPQGYPGQPGQPDPGQQPYPHYAQSGQWDYQQGQPGYAPMPPAYPMAPPPPQGTNGLAVASLIFGVIGGCLLSIPFGIIALTQIKQRNQNGRGLAIAGLIASGVWALVAVLVFAVGVATDSKNSASQDNSTRTGQPDAPTSISVDDVKTGDCLQTVQEGTHIRRVTILPCDSPHDAEVITQVHLAGSWPGSADASSQKANDSCEQQLQTMLGNSSMYDQLQLFILYPATQTQWNKSGGRAACLVQDGSGKKLTGKVPR
ncbi:DUF4190 domain-containing protein [Nocardia sp. CDC160]|uniref:DUF4190 domain-containing protein n=1 Tax=Nocardia sp. CDC160 TaxID=3112166 RepID=UPI002DBF9948|nr:DUF4190 domain-containing protein [Nocardia sp. CDC160]MEC3913376.1 DUF4190 domain-containing protein [Nocardia sp. CDC160]